VSEAELHQQIEEIRADLAEIKHRLFGAWKRNRWRHELLHMEVLFTLCLIGEEQSRAEYLALLEDATLRIMRHFAEEEGGEVIVREAAHLLGLIRSVHVQTRPVPQPVWSLTEGS